MRRSSSQGIRKGGKASLPKRPSRARKSHRRAQELSPRERATAEILRAISQSPHDEQPVFDIIAESAARLCRAEYVAVYRYDGTLIHFAAHHGLSPRALEEMGRVYPLNPGHATTVARSILAGAVAEIPDIRVDPHYAAGLLASLANARSITAVPMMKDGRPTGSIAVARSKPGYFPTHYIKLLESFADQAVIAIQNAQLFEEVQQRNRELVEALDQQTATGAVLRVIAASPSDIQPVLDAVAENAARLCQAHDAVITLRVGDRASAQAHYGPMPRVHHEWPLDRGLVGARAIIDRCPVHVHDALEEAIEFPLSYKVALDEGQRTLLAVPLLHHDEAIGALAVRRDYVEPFTDKQIDLLKTFADQAVIAIENVRLFNEVQTRNRELTEALEQQTATSTILRAIAGSPTDVQPVLEAVAESAARLCQAYDAVLFLREGDTLVWKSHCGPTPASIMKKVPISRDWVAGRAFLERLPCHVHDGRDWADFPMGMEFARQLGHRTALAVPMMREKNAIGVLAVRRLEERPFSQKQIDLLCTFADQAVIAIQNTHLFNEVQQRNRELVATSEVLGVISRSPTDVQPVFKAIAESAAKLCNSETAYVQRFDGRLSHFGAHYGLTPEMEKATQKAFPIAPGNRSLGTRAILSGKVEFIPDYLSDPDYDPDLKEAARLAKVRGAVAVPMLQNGEPVGAIILDRREPGFYPERQVELLKTFADQAVIAIENVRLFKEVEARTQDLSEALQQQTATADVLKAISRSTFDLPAVLNALVTSAASLCGSNYGAIFLRDGDRLHGAAFGVRSAEDEADFQSSPMLINRKTISGRVMLSGRAEHIPDVLADPEYDYPQLRRFSETRALLGVPLLRDGKAEGVFTLGRPEPGAFTERHSELIQTFADQAVIAIENARLFEEVQAKTRDLSEALKQQIATADVLKTISQSVFDLKAVLGTLVRSAMELCNATQGVVFLREGDILRPEMQLGFSQEFERFLEETPHRVSRASPMGQAVLTGTAQHIPDVLADPDFRLHKGQALAGYRATISIPLKRDDQVVGVFALGRPSPTPFTEREIELVETFSHQAVIAIENVRLFEQVQARTRELTEALQQQTATADVLKVISRSAFDLKPVLQTLVESAARLCDADLANITRQIDGMLVRTEFYGATPEYIEQIRGTSVVPDRGSAQGRALLEGKVVHIADIRADPDYTFEDARRIGGFRTILGVPMMRDGVPIGSMALARSEVRPFTDKQIELVSTFADQAAIAIENVRLFESVEARTRELARSLEELRAAQDRLIHTEKLASLGQLTAGIAHEIKNPLNFVNNFSALSVELVDELGQLIEGTQTEQQRADAREIMTTLKSNLEKVSQHGRRADSIVKNMLLHSRQGSREHRLADINAIVEESLNLAYHGARAERQGFNITLEKSFDPEAGEVDIFPQEITRVLLNLISNGFYATAKRRESAAPGDEPVLSAATRNLGDRVEIRIRDNGTGIPAEIRSKLFTPFFTTKPPGEGTGLGLSLSHDIIAKQHAGSISVESEPGKYTEFVIVLPRDAASLAASGGQA